jgi:outer membrane protein assembly factor BamB
LTSYFCIAIFLDDMYKVKYLLLLHCVAIISVLLHVEGALNAEDWTRFRGPNGTGVAEAAKLPTHFDVRRNLHWRTPLPAGHSSPVFTTDRIFVTASEEGLLYTICLDLTSGKILWQQEIPRHRREPFHRVNGPASPSPVTDGSNVYVFFGDYGVVSYESNGKERWRVPLGPFSTPNGHGTSPILVNDTVVLMSDQDEMSYLLALDCKNGEIRWKVERPEVVHGYSTPTLYRPKDGPLQIITPSSYRISSYEATTGKRLWWSSGPTWQVKPIAVVDGEMIYATGWAPVEYQNLPPYETAIKRGDIDGDGKISEQEAIENGWRHGGGWGLVDLDADGKLNQRDWEFFRARRMARNATFALRPPSGANGDITAEATMWRYEKAVPVVSSPLLYRKILYTIKDGGILTALDPRDGQVLKQGRLTGAIDKYYASPVAANGKIYFASQNGKISVVQAGTNWQLLTVNDLMEACYASPSIADNKLYVRTESALYAFGQTH